MKRCKSAALKMGDIDRLFCATGLRSAGGLEAAVRPGRCWQPALRLGPGRAASSP